MMRPARMTAHCRTDCLLAYVHPAHHPPLLPPSSTIIGGSFHKYHFCRDKTRLLSRQKDACRDKTYLFSRQTYFCRDKTHVLSRQTLVSRTDKHVFVATKVILMAASASDTPTAVSRTSTINAVLTVTLRPRCVTHGRVPARVSVMYKIMIGDYQSFPLRAVCSVAVTSHPHTSRAQAATSHRT